MKNFFKILANTVNFFYGEIRGKHLAVASQAELDLAATKPWWDMVTHIYCQGAEITRMPKLPIALEELEAKNNPGLGDSLGQPNFFAHCKDLKKVFACRTPLRSPGQYVLDFSQNKHLQVLYVCDAEVTEIRFHPESELQQLMADNCSLTGFEWLPTELRLLRVEHNRDLAGNRTFTKLPAVMPKRLEQLYVTGNDLAELPDLIQMSHLQHLYAAGNNLMAIEAWPDSLEQIFLCRNKFVQLPAVMPKSCYEFFLTSNQTEVQIPLLNEGQTMDEFYVNHSKGAKAPMQVVLVKHRMGIAV